MMTKHKMNLFCGMLLLSASLFVEKAQAMFPERYVSEESAARADTINFRLASAGEAKRLIAAKDSYTANWSPFDIAARLENPEGKREDLVSLAVREVREWTAEEAQQIERIRKNLNDTIRKYGYRIPFPKEIVLVKTTMKDEGGAGGYTRSNWIALTDATFQRGTEASHTRLLVHETFHILTRLNPKRNCTELSTSTSCPKRLSSPKIYGKAVSPIPMSVVAIVMRLLPLTVSHRTAL